MYFGKVMIPHDKNEGPLQELLTFGIDSAILFPGLEGIGQRVATGHKLGRYGRGRYYTL